jgi:hypothetical protein
MSEKKKLGGGGENSQNVKTNISLFCRKVKKKRVTLFDGKFILLFFGVQ